MKQQSWSHGEAANMGEGRMPCLHQNMVSDWEQTEVVIKCKKKNLRGF
jgi:hypothetical protein